MTRPLIKRLLISSTLAFACLQFAAVGFAANEADVDQIIAFDVTKLTGLKARPEQIKSLHTKFVDAQGVLDEHALFEKILTSDIFVDGRLATFVSRMSNEEQEPFEDVDDYQAALLLNIMSGADMRGLFAQYFAIARKDEETPQTPSLETFRLLAGNIKAHSDIPKNYHLVTIDPKAPNKTGYYEGLFTTEGFGLRYIKAGTNRRTIRAIFDIFLCSKIETWKDASLDPYYIGQDVDRKPGGRAENFQTNCRACHAPMDAMRGAFAYHDFDPMKSQVTKSDKVVPKYNQNATVFPANQGGFETLDSEWENLLTSPENRARFGWRGKTSGRGVLQLSKMIANSEKFQTCMSQKVIATFCDKTPTEVANLSTSPEFKKIADDFRTKKYQVKALIEETVRSNLCHKN